MQKDLKEAKKQINNPGFYLARYSFFSHGE
jgi:hypothetical protein